MVAATTPETLAKVAGASKDAIGMVVVPMRIRIIGIVIIRVGVSIRIAIIIVFPVAPIRGARSQGNNQIQEEQITGPHRVYLTFSRLAQPFPCKGKPWLASAGSDVLAGTLIIFSINKNSHHSQAVKKSIGALGASQCQMSD
jgi:hypothetical protein